MGGTVQKPSGGSVDETIRVHHRTVACLPKALMAKAISNVCVCVCLSGVGWMGWRWASILTHRIARRQSSRHTNTWRQIRRQINKWIGDTEAYRVWEQSQVPFFHPSVTRRFQVCVQAYARFYVLTEMAKTREEGQVLRTGDYKVWFVYIFTTLLLFPVRVSHHHKKISSQANSYNIFAHIACRNDPHVYDY